MPKCEILCMDCGRHYEERHGDGSQYPGEHIKYVLGVTKENPHLGDGISRCDSCYLALPAGTDCVAVTVWTDSQQAEIKINIEDWDWESDYLTKKDRSSTQSQEKS